MIEITAKMVRDLRMQTNAPMMNCKHALLETKGNMDVAKEWLRKKGLSDSDTKSGRETSDGLVSVEIDNKNVTMVEINCETDFVAKNEHFKKFVSESTKKWNGPGTYNLPYDEIISIVGENVKHGQMINFECDKGHPYSYIHNQVSDNLGKLGVIVVLKNEDSDIGRRMGMHIAASNPLSIDKDGLTKEWLTNEERILTEQASESGKSKTIVNAIVNGRLNKRLKEVCLLEQSYILNTEKTVQEILEENNNEIIKFYRFKVGE